MADHPLRPRIGDTVALKDVSDGAMARIQGDFCVRIRSRGLFVFLRNKGTWRAADEFDDAAKWEWRWPENEARLPATIAAIDLTGGSSEWKEATARTWADLARDRGAKCHVGRVNSLRRLLIVKAAGAHSFDGSGPSRFAKALEEMQAARAVAAQVGLVLLVAVDVFFEADGEVWSLRVQVADAAPLEAILLAALDHDLGADDAFEVQTDAGIWSREDGPGWSFLTWEQLEET